jgi:integrase
MPRQSKGPRLYFQPARKGGDGRIVEQAVWVIRDGRIKRSTGFGKGQDTEAQRALADYILERTKAPRTRDRDPAQVKVPDVVSIYLDDVAGKHGRPLETAARMDRILDFFGDLTLAQINQRTCQQYVDRRGAAPRARRELEDLRAAIRYHWKQGLCSGLTPVVLPAKGRARERWLTRSEAARLLWAAYRYRETQQGTWTARYTLRHIARFILVGLYTGTRAGAICNAAFMETLGRGWIDLESGIFHRQALGAARTKKRAPTIRIPPRLLAHIRRWHRLGIAKNAVVEWHGEPVKKINKGFRRARAIAGLSNDVVPHVLRHSCATWLAQRRTPINEICGFLGMTEAVFETTYGHHHPDYQANAVNALSNRRTK